MTQRDLIPFLGIITRVSEVLSGKRPITMAIGWSTSAGRLDTTQQVITIITIILFREAPK